MNFSLPKPVLSAMNILESNGFEVFLVGGCVRNYYLNKKIADYDLTTNATPQQMLQIFSDYRCIETGLQHGTICVIIESMQLEITTYRIDGNYEDNRHPDSVSFTKDLNKDLARRDFTMNAIAYHPQKDLCDPFNGKKDIENKIIRCVGNPDKRFEEDALRILRGLRFASEYGFAIEPKTASAMERNRFLLQNISAERIYQEFTKLLCGQYVYTIMRQFPSIFLILCPPLKNTLGFEQQNKWHIFTVYEHIIHSVSNIPNKPILRWTMLLHDIAKPQCFFIDNKRVGHFKGHPEISSQMAESYLKLLHADTKTISQVCNLIKHHDERFEINKKSLCKLLNKLGGFENIQNFFLVRKADSNAQNLAMSQSSIELINQAEKYLCSLNNDSLCYSIESLAINGNDCIQIGITGPAIGRALNNALAAVINDECKNNKASIIAYLIEKEEND